MTTQRVKSARKANIPSSKDHVDMLEDIGKATIKKLLDPQGTAESMFRKLQDTQGDASNAVRKKYGHLLDDIKSVSTGVSSALQHFTNCSMSIEIFDVSADHYRPAALLLVQLFNIRVQCFQAHCSFSQKTSQLSRHVLQ